jgi:hypothetical protein
MGNGHRKQQPHSLLPCGFTNEGSIQGAVTFYFATIGQLGTTGSTFASNAGGNITARSYVGMGAGTTFIQDSGIMSQSGGLSGFAELDGGSLDVTGPGAAEFFAFDTVSMTGDLQPGQALDIAGTTGGYGSACAAQDGIVNATGSFTNNGTISMFLTGDPSCPAANSALTVPAGGVITNRGEIQAAAGKSPRGSRTISGTVDNAGGTIAVDSGEHLTISPGSVDNAGTVQLGGLLAVSGDFTQEPSGTTIGATTGQLQATVPVRRGAIGVAIS